MAIATSRSKHVSRVAVTLAPFLVSVAITALTYGASTSYGFMFDDPLDLPRASGRTYWDILASTDGTSSYYRPLALLIWKVIYDLLGGHNPYVLHALSLAVHAVNGWLVYILGRHLQGRVAGYMALVVFLLFPFSYQAVEIVNAFFHPLVTMFLLAAACLYIRWRECGSRWPLAGAVVAGVLAVLTHEYGVVLVALVVGIEAVFVLTKRVAAPSRSVGLFAIVSFGFLLVWWLIPRGAFAWTFDLISLKLNTLYFFQGLTFPTAALLSEWPARLGTSLEWTLLILGVPVLAVVVALHALAKRVLVLAFALLWVVAGALPTIVMLQISYVIDGPRLLYLASVGIALVWGGTLSALTVGKRRESRIVGGLVVCIAIVAISWQCWQFLSIRQPLFVEGASLVRTLAATATDTERPGRTYVNLPSWLSPRTSDYLLGHSGVTMIPSYIGLGRAVYLLTNQQPEISSLAYDVVATQWDSFYGPHGPSVGLPELDAAFRQGGGVYCTRFFTGTLGLEYVGAILAQDSPVPSGYMAQFGTWGRLLGASTRVQESGVEVSLRWGALGGLQRDCTMFVHVYDASHKLVTQADGYALGQMFPPARWRQGDIVEDVRQIELPADLPSGVYEVVVGAYDRANVQREPAVSKGGAHYPDDAVPIGQFSRR